MSYGRHSYVAFYPSDWLGGTARLTRMHRSVYFDICCYNWDTAKPCPKAEAAMMVCDLENGEAIIGELISMGKLILYDDGAIGSPRALLEASKSLELWEKKSQGGKSRAKTAISTHGKSPTKSDASSPPIEPEPEPEPDLSFKKKKEDIPQAASNLFFEGAVIRLKESDFRKWERAYPKLNLMAVLQARDDWLSTEADDAARKKWFISTSNWLLNQQKAAPSAKPWMEQPIC